MKHGLLRSAASHLNRALWSTTALVLLSAVTAAQNEKPAAPPEKTPQLNVIVVDRANHPLDDVRREDLQLNEDGAQQTISHFALDQRPVTCGFIIDASGSVRRILNHLIDAAKTAARGLRDGDEAFVARFVDRDIFQIKQELTSDREEIADALDGIYVEGGQTAVHDAIDKSLKYLEENQTGDRTARRRILILITDGEDRASRMKDAKALLARLRETDVQVFVLGLTKFSGLQSSAGRAMDLLSSLADQSGGLAFFPLTAAGLPPAAQDVARALHTQYTIGYSTKSARTERNVEVKWTGQNGLGKRKVVFRQIMKTH